MMARGEVKAHAKEGAEGTEEMGSELGAAVGGNVEWDSVLREHVCDKDVCDFSSSDCIHGRYKNTFLG